MSKLTVIGSFALGAFARSGAMEYGTSGYNPATTNPGTSSVGAQLQPWFWSKVAVKAARRFTYFSQLGDQLIQPKNFGDTITKYAEVPIIHPLNLNDQAIDANGAKLVKNMWYSYDVNGVMLAPTTGSATLELAQAVAGTVSVKSGNGNMWGGDNTFSVIQGSFPALTEEGGRVNAVGMTRLVLEAKVQEFGFHVPFTQKMIDMDTEAGLLARISQEVGIAQGEIREKQIQVALITAAQTNKVFAGGASATTAINSLDTVQFQDLRGMEQSLKMARAPKQTKIIDGSTKYGTTVIGAGYTAFVGQELYPTLEDMTWNGVSVWKPVESYAAAGTVMEHEIGKVSHTRFIEVFEMSKFTGAGATVASDSNPLKANYYATGANFDVFPILYVGTDSFGTVGFEGDVARVNTIMPKPDAYMDPYGKRGAVAISWYFGLLVYRPERIRMLLSSAKIS